MDRARARGARLDAHLGRRTLLERQRRAAPAARRGGRRARDHAEVVETAEPCRGPARRVRLRARGARPGEPRAAQARAPQPDRGGAARAARGASWRGSRSATCCSRRVVTPGQPRRRTGWALPGGTRRAARPRPGAAGDRGAAGVAGAGGAAGRRAGATVPGAARALQMAYAQQAGGATGAAAARGRGAAGAGAAAGAEAPPSRRALRAALGTRPAAPAEPRSGRLETVRQLAGGAPAIDCRALFPADAVPGRPVARRSCANPMTSEVS